MSTIDPDESAWASPLLISTVPLTPELPALPLDSITLPEEVDAPDPDVIDTFPPAPAEVAPA
jgi:hypothetical protein